MVEAAELVVSSAMNSDMKLPIDGQFGQHRGAECVECHIIGLNGMRLAIGCGSAVRDGKESSFMNSGLCPDSNYSSNAQFPQRQQFRKRIAQLRRLERFLQHRASL